MESLTLQATSRQTMGRATDTLRQEGSVPAVMYGFEIEPMNITVDRNALEKAFKQAGESSVVELSIDNATNDVLIQDIQRDALTGFITHADFRRIDMNTAVEATISLEFVGEPKAVKELGGTFVSSREEVEVKALPKYLVPEIEVDISGLATFDDVLRVSDLVVPEGIQILTSPDASIAGVQPPRSEKEMEALDEAVDADVSAVEVSTEKKEEDAADKKEE